MPSKRVHLTFPEELVQQPIMSRLVRDYDIEVNVRRADVDEKVGWMMLELSGDEAALRDGVAWLAAQGITVSDVDGDIVAG